MRTVIALALALTLKAATAFDLVQPFLCLEVCGSTHDQIEQNIYQVARNPSLFNAVSFEAYNLGPNSTLIRNNLTDAAAQFKYVAGLRAVAMISSYPYPPQFIDYMRQVFDNPQPFIQQCILEARRQSLWGFNIDWEPLASTVQPGDADRFTAFLKTFAAAMHRSGLGVSVDIADWSSLWDWAGIATTGVDYIIPMTTYTDNDTTWYPALQRAAVAFAPEQLVVGLEVNTTSGAPYPEAQLAARLQAIKNTGARGIALWRSPITQEWLDLLQA